MKSENNNLEKNISRLVKLAGDSNQPNKAFTDSLINRTIDELTQKAGPATRERKSMIMTAKKIFAYAASILVVCGVLIALMTPKLQKIGQQARDTAKPVISGQYEVRSKSEPGPAKIEYTEAGKQAGDIVKPHPVLSPATQGQPNVYADKTVAVAGEEKLGVLTQQMTGQAVDRLSFNAGVSSEKARGLSYIVPLVPACRPPMAHGGTKPPNGEDVDAMFFKNYGVNPFIDTEDDHLSTFAMDVDTASYTLVRGYLHDGHLPSNDAVRVEEFVNYFKYGYAAPQKDDFAVYAEASPWQFGTGRQNSYLLRLALKARQISDENRKPAILTFVIDVSGSMSREDRLGLVKKSLRLLIDKLRPDDKIGIAVYESRGRKVMDHKGLVDRDDILAAIDSLSPGGSTYAEEGIKIGYEMAERAFKRDCINRVILCTDGVANEGRTGADEILKVIKEKADKGITLSAIGFGMGNYNDVLLEQLGDKGNGHYAYVDTIAEAKRIFEENLTGTLQLIARDAKVQVDFNPDVVRSYRLIGYENRDVPDEKFRDDKYDGGEVGAGHSVTALYEIKLWPEKKGKIATTYVRYKNAETGAVTEFKSDFKTVQLNRSFDDSSKQFRLTATVAEFAEILRKSYWAKGATLEPVLQQAQTLAGEFKEDADVIELVDLISKAGRLMPKPSVEPAED
ncbi:MAG: von Willebrand factor type A domain-containing protein, partial [Sedimentisphaerales bacterium]|nr:von Willebrand factor type A domain-containing protein [Sedimentisphaerales bacterium]